LGVDALYKKIEFECGVIASLGVHPKNVALGYDVRKSAQAV